MDGLTAVGDVLRRTRARHAGGSREPAGRKGGGAVLRSWFPSPLCTRHVAAPLNFQIHQSVLVVSSDFFSSSASKSFFRFFGLDGWKPFFPRKESDSPEPGRSFGGAFLDTIATRRDS